MSDRMQVNVQLKDNSENKSYRRLFNILADNFISIDLINVFPTEKIFTIDDKDFDKFEALMGEKGLKYSYVKGCSKVAIIGSRMRGIPGVMAKILNALSRGDIEVLQTADSHTTIWCLVPGEDTKKAIKVLHDEFELGV